MAAEKQSKYRKILDPNVLYEGYAQKIGSLLLGSTS